MLEFYLCRSVKNIKYILLKHLTKGIILCIWADKNIMKDNYLTSVNSLVYNSKVNIFSN